MIVNAAPLLATILCLWLGLARISRYSEDILGGIAHTGWRSRLGTRSLKLGEPLWMCALRFQSFVSSADVGLLTVVKEDGLHKSRVVNSRRLFQEVREIHRFPFFV
jgi:hypothetical protein